MKFHRVLAEHTVTALENVFEGGYQADRVLERLFKKEKKLGARDRRFVAESTYELIRHWRKFIYLAGLEEKETLSRGDVVRLIGVWQLLKGETVPPWPEFKGLDQRRMLEKEKGIRSLAVLESIPDWLNEFGSKELGEAWPDALFQLNKTAPVVLRANRLKTTREKLQRRLEDARVESFPAPDTEDGLILRYRSNVFTLDAFKEGLFEIQDGASQQIAPMLDPKPGERIIDACAGAGGKTLHMAALMKNKGKIIAMDVTDKKLDELKRRCRRAGVDVVETKLIDSMKVVKRLEGSADAVLLDVPCTGMGVLRRNPDKKWKLTLEEVERLKILQAQILNDYSRMVKSHGRLVYATCSILPSENELQVEAFLAANPNWKLERERRFMPGQEGYDGFYAALLINKN
ncbi:MAG TPA: methyltransferase domain-containing protein [Bdellovibrionales bacterium]|nr:methyltransferase domain-containing protein [Bdellovibrionales bacterium]